MADFVKTGGITATLSLVLADQIDLKGAAAMAATAASGVAAAIISSMTAGASARRDIRASDFYLYAAEEVIARTRGGK